MSALPRAKENMALLKIRDPARVSISPRKVEGSSLNAAGQRAGVAAGFALRLAVALVGDFPVLCFGISRSKCKPDYTQSLYPPWYPFIQSSAADLFQVRSVQSERRDA